MSSSRLLLRARGGHSAALIRRGVATGGVEGRLAGKGKEQKPNSGTKICVEKEL
jgi:hypothetical protein